jgi:D-alanine-D-alanine ligase
METIAIITGGYGPEREISIKSASLIEASIDTNLFDYRVIYFDAGQKWYERDSKAMINKNDFSVKINGKKIKFDAVILMIHGDPAENGQIQGYFDGLKIPYANCDGFVSGLTFNKTAAKQVLQHYGIPMSKSKLFRRGDAINRHQLEMLGFPLFVKPNRNGSSYGISKVKNAEELDAALEKAFKYDNEIMVEVFMEGREFSSGAIRLNNVIHTFPLTEIITHRDYFDYAAKYQNESQEITPAEIDDKLSERCNACTKRIYRKLNCVGMIRVDYILKDGIFHMIEVNTIPGLSPQSIIPQQVTAYGWTMKQMVNELLEETLHKQGVHLQ